MNFLVFAIWRPDQLCALLSIVVHSAGLNSTKSQIPKPYLGSFFSPVFAAGLRYLNFHSMISVNSNRLMANRNSKSFFFSITINY